VKVLVTGSRDWPERQRVWDALNFVGDVTTVVHGNCPTGADQMAKAWAMRHKVEMSIFPARWSEHGRAAGPIRNEQMVNAGADICLAFISECTSSRCDIEEFHYSHGATGCADLAESAGIKTIRIHL
jgi:hypothetical protein